MPNPSTHILEDSNASSETLPSNYLLCMFPVSSASPVLLVHLFCYKHIQDSPLKKKKKKRHTYIWILTTISECPSESNFFTSRFPLFPIRLKMNCDLTSIIKLLIHLGSLITCYNFKVHWIFLSFQFTRSLCSIQTPLSFPSFLKLTNFQSWLF